MGKIGYRIYFRPLSINENVFSCVFFLMVVEPSKVYYLHIVELSHYPIPVQILLTFSSLCMFSVAISKKIKKNFLG